MRRTSVLWCIRAAAIGLPVIIACGSSPTGSSAIQSSGAGSSGGNGESGGESTGGSSGSNSGGGGNASGNGNSSGTGNSSGGASSGNGGPGGSGTSSSSSTTASSSGGTSNPDAGRSCGTAPAATMISDFEEGLDVMVKQQGRDGVWSTYQAATTRAAMPALNASGLMPASMAPSDDHPGMCNAYAMHVSDVSSSCWVGTDHYCGLVTQFDGTTTATSWMPYDLSAYDGVQFDIKTGAASQGPVYFEVLTKESQPGSPDGSGTASNTTVDEYNNRGYLMTATGSTPSGTGVAMPTSMTTVYVPFGMLIPRYFPQPGASGCGTSKCQSPFFVPKDTLGLQFSVYDDFATQSQASYDLWIDNVSFFNFTSANEGLVPDGYTMPAFKDGKTGWKCSVPTFMGGKPAAGKYLLWAYRNWRTNFVRESGSSTTPCTSSSSSCTVISPEVSGGSVVSEGIAYGMLIAAYMGDEKLFGQLWSYWSGHGATGLLMNWEYDITGSSMKGAGSATDADEDAAFALYVASKVFSDGSTYQSNYNSMTGQIWSSDFSSGLPTFGSNGSGSGLMNPSYFAPAYYRIFGGNFTAAVDSVYSALNSIGSTLPPAWCQNGCSSPGSGGRYANDTDYQYDAHRVPWRIGIDYCWNGESRASSYVSKISQFFSSLDANGIDSLYDEYTTSGSVCTTCNPAAEPNSMSLVGTAGVGALAGGMSYQTFADDAWQFVLDGLNRGTPNILATGNNYYTYFNTTVGLLTALTMSGNFYQP